MYPISLGFDEAVNRLEALLANQHPAEALVTSVFTLEKTMRRGLKLAILARGFSAKQSQRMIEGKGFKDIKEMWDLFDKDYQTLQQFIGNDKWQYIPQAVQMRNKMVHGIRVYDLEKCSVYANQVVAALRQLRAAIQDQYGYDPWKKIRGKRIPRLQWRA
jgi:hypothetical protein